MKVSGSDIRQRAITLQLDKKRKLIYDFNAFCLIEEELESLGNAFDLLSRQNYHGLRFLLLAGLLHDNSDMDIETVGEMADFGDLFMLQVEISQAIWQALPKIEESQNKEAEGGGEEKQWEWATLLYQAMNILHIPEENFWKMTPRKFFALVEIHNVMHSNTKKEEVVEGFIDDFD